MSCCHVDPYHEMFDADKAQQDLDDYLRTGYKKSSRPMFSLLKSLPVEGKHLLDIGGGIGAIPFELFDRGLAQATHNDISPFYVEKFLEESRRRGLQERVSSVEGDITAVIDRVPRADIVTLDKVICCYPDYPALVRQSGSRAKRWYVINLPRNNILVRVGLWLDYHWRKWRNGKAFSTYVHPVNNIIGLLKRDGFQMVKQVYQREWTALLFEREGTDV